MVDPAMANSLIKVRGWKDQADPQAYLESLSLDFTIPGYTVELIVRHLHPCKQQFAKY